MNAPTTFALKPIVIFAVVAGLVILAMVMGRKNSQRTGFGWWIGLGILLFVISMFFSIFSLRSSVTEVRYNDRSAFREALAEVKGNIQNAVETVRDSIQDGVQEVKDGVEEARQSIQRTTQSSGRKSKTSSTTITVVANPNNTPMNTVTLLVNVKDKERSQNKDEVKNTLIEKATRSVNRWASERLPIPNYAFNLVDEAWLQEHRAFPEEVEFTQELLPRVNPSELDPLFGGTLKVVLTPAVQNALLEIGCTRLQTQLQDDQFTAQGIICICLLGLTGFAGLMALAKTLFTRRVMTA